MFVVLLLVIDHDRLSLLTLVIEEQSETIDAEYVFELTAYHGGEFHPVGTTEHVRIALLHLEIVLYFYLVDLLLLQVVDDVLQVETQQLAQVLLLQVE